MNNHMHTRLGTIQIPLIHLEWMHSQMAILMGQRSLMIGIDQKLTVIMRQTEKSGKIDYGTVFRFGIGLGFLFGAFMKLELSEKLDVFWKIIAL